MTEHARTGDSPHLIQDYLQALSSRDLNGCTALYAADAIIHFGAAHYAGREATVAWHRDRFAANFEVLRVNSVTTDGNVVTVEVVVTSDKLRAWRIDTLAGTATFRLNQVGVIESAHFQAKLYNLLEGW